MAPNSRDRLLSTLIVCSLCMAAVGCRSMSTVHPVADPGGPAFASVQLGDTVEIQTREGTRRFVVKEIDSDAIVSVAGEKFSREQIIELKRETVSAGKTTALIAGLSYLLGVVLNLLL